MTDRNTRSSNSGEALYSRVESRISPRVSSTGTPAWTYGSSTCSSDSDLPDHTDEECGRIKGNKGSSKPWYAARSYLGAPAQAAARLPELSQPQVYPSSSKASGSRWRIALAALNVVLLLALAGCGAQIWSMQKQAISHAIIISSLRDSLQQTGFELDDQRTSVVALRVKLSELQTNYSEEKSLHEKDRTVNTKLNTELGQAVVTKADMQKMLVDKTKLADRLALENMALTKKLKSLEEDTRMVKKEMQTLNSISSKLHVD